MPHYGLPPVLFNIVCALNEALPASARSVFQSDFFKRLELMPHAEQDPYDEAPELELVPVLPGTGHLDVISRWFMLGVLVDGAAGTLKAAESAGDRAMALQVARLYLRWLDEDYPSDSEWHDITDEAKNPEPEAPSHSYYTAWSLAEIGTDSPTLVSMALAYAASNWYGARLKPPPCCCVIAPSFVGRVVDRGVNWLAVRLGRGPSNTTADPTHYYWQATWLLDLLNLRWLPTDPEEERLFRSVLGGKATQARAIHRQRALP